jgi:hypothetical protein
LADEAVHKKRDGDRRWDDICERQNDEVHHQKTAMPKAEPRAMT